MAPSVTNLQLMILQALWIAGEATVIDVHESLRRQRRIAQSTVATLLSRMETKGMVARRLDGRQHLYRATVAEEQVQRSMVAEFMTLSSGLFGGDFAGLMSHLVNAQDVDEEGLARAREVIEQKEKQLRGEDS
jgi:BlaI family penicillinase repressor